jgi:hypothetical protein
MMIEGIMLLLVLNPLGNQHVTGESQMAKNLRCNTTGSKTLIFH